MSEELWHYACQETDLVDDDVVGMQVGGRDVALYRIDGDTFASANLCTHGNARLSDGFLDDGQIECPLHQGCFDVRSGKALCSPVTVDLQIYGVRCSEGKVYVLLPA